MKRLGPMTLMAAVIMLGLIIALPASADARWRGGGHGWSQGRHHWDGGGRPQPGWHQSAGGNWAQGPGWHRADGPGRRYADGGPGWCRADRPRFYGRPYQMPRHDPAPPWRPGW